jgi:hypothetical protein
MFENKAENAAFYGAVQTLSRGIGKVPVMLSNRGNLASDRRVRQWLLCGQVQAFGRPRA